MQKPARKETPAQQGGDRWPFTLLLTAGIVLMAASRLNVFPATSIATLLSEDGTLTSSFIGQLQHSQWILALTFLAAAFFALRADRIFAFLSDELLRPSRAVFFSLLGLSGFGLALIVQTFLFSGIPHVTDAICHFFQAKVLVLGHLWAPVPPCAEHFYQHGVAMTLDGKWFSKYPPGHALLLAAGLKIGAMWAVVPLCSAAAAVALAWLSERFYGRFVGRVTGLLFLVSPLALLLGGSFMSHTTALAFALMGAACFVSALDHYDQTAFSRLAAILGGLLLTWSAMIRPQDAWMAGLLGLCGALISPAAARKRCAALAAYLILGALPVLLFAGWWNDRLHGSFFETGYGLNKAGLLFPLYQDHYGLSDSFPFRRALIVFVWTMSRFNRVLLSWPASILFIPIAFLSLRKSRADILCLLGCLLVASFYFFHHYNGQEFEARYYYLALPFALTLTARGMKRSIELLRLKNEKAARAFVLALIAAFFVHGAADYWVGYVIPRYSNDYEQASPVLQRVAQRDGLRNAVVLVKSTGKDEFRYSSGFLYNDPLLRANVIYARDMGEKNDCLLNALGGRRIYRFIPDPDWKDGFLETVR